MPQRLDAVPRSSLFIGPTPVEELPRLRAALGRAPRILIKRDDAIPFCLGGTKVRKLEYFAGRALADGADTLVTSGGTQSHHVRLTAALAGKLGLKAVLILNREPARERRSSAILDRLFGADIQYAPDREERGKMVRHVIEELRDGGARPYELPLGGSSALGALGLVRGVHELVKQGIRPDAIVVATSTGGTQAGLVAGCLMAKLETRVLGISVDSQSTVLGVAVDQMIQGIPGLIELDRSIVKRAQEILVADTFVGDGYLAPTDAGLRAARLLARTEGILLDNTYTAKAMAGLLQLIKDGTFMEHETVLFWHTGGLPSVFR
jgi:1-aminocyclopropane-1-carboxylate deaminase/D-cysteine desulfhydrase-like pyridoxal-dependent ACC family enzyme